jgi:hypothetical protein
MSSLTDSSRARRLENKIGVIFGTGGEVGGAVAKELAAQGARVSSYRSQGDNSCPRCSLPSVDNVYYAHAPKPGCPTDGRLGRHG